MERVEVDNGRLEPSQTIQTNHRLADVRVPCTKDTNMLLGWCLMNSALDPYPHKPMILVRFPLAQSYQGIPHFPGFPCKNSKFNWL